MPPKGRHGRPPALVFLFESKREGFDSGMRAAARAAPTNRHSEPTRRAGSVRHGPYLVGVHTGVGIRCCGRQTPSPGVIPSDRRESRDLKPRTCMEQICALEILRFAQDDKSGERMRRRRGDSRIIGETHRKFFQKGYCKTFQTVLIYISFQKSICAISSAG